MNVERKQKMTYKYLESGLWIREIEGGYRIGLSEKGQSDIGDVMFVELPEFGEHMEKGESLISVEGSKAVTELTVPMSGTVGRVHKELEDDPSLMNGASSDEIWILELSDVTDFDETEFTKDPWEHEN